MRPSRPCEVVFTAQAIRDLAGIRGYIERDNAEAAARLARLIIDATRRLGRFPESGRRGLLAGTRELIVPGTPYFMPYRVVRGRVELLRVLHGSLEYPVR